MSEGGRPSSYRDEYARQGKILCEMGATDQEIADFFEMLPSEEDWLYACLLLIRNDRKGVFAARKNERLEKRRNALCRSPSLRVRNATSARMWSAMKGATDGALFSRLGYSASDLANHLEAKFLPGMSWANYGNWHIDHVKPCALFDLTNNAQFLECWGLANLQPLWASDNCRKGAKYVEA